MKKHIIHSLNVKLLIWALAFIVPIIGLFAGGVSLAMDSFEQQLILTNRQILKPYISEMEVTLETIRKYVATTEVPTEVLERLESESESVRLNALSELNDYYTRDIFTYPMIDAVFLQKEEKFRFIRNVNSDYCQQCEAAQGVEKWVAQIGEKENPFEKGYQKFEAGGRPYFLLAIREEDVIWGCWIKADNFLKEIERQKIDGLEAVFLADKEGIWENSFAEQDQKQFFPVEQSSSDGSFEIIALLNREKVFRSFEELNRILIVLICFSILILAAYLVYLSVRLIKPVKNLTLQMNRIKKGDFSSHPIPEGLDRELSEVYEAMNSMTAEIEHLKIDVYEEKLRKQEANMQLLQMQIKPHFFLNALTAIMGFAQAKDYEMVQKMTVCLSKHFRYILYKGGFISLEEELEHIQNYFEIQKIKKQTEFQYEIQVEEELYEEEIPILSLQTLVENAMKHSLNEDVEIKIQGFQREENGKTDLILAVDDNGNGFPENILQELNQGKKITTSKQDGGIGLYNVMQRLAILYHGEASILFSNRKEGGAHVEMKIPKTKGW
ncbi:MAG: histidine kinase [Eubacteriales bacterium]|nr:histidine kinase [Eubacteriales bacterium]